MINGTFCKYRANFRLGNCQVLDPTVRKSSLFQLSLLFSLAYPNLQGSRNDKKNEYRGYHYGFIYGQISKTNNLKARCKRVYTKSMCIILLQQQYTMGFKRLKKKVFKEGKKLLPLNGNCLENLSIVRNVNTFDDTTKDKLKKKMCY